ncbi:trypsin-like peptidase domain-containing protein [Actinoplanes sp. CA-051413]|uniref:nSTAND1 domain-containing NTPase n=1 Tax=Actinoplanes sp. CA-051413 TaxID=3239899 RepID=UPI003D96CAD1
MAELARPGSAVVRFRDGGGTVVGAGFLVGNGLVVTCAHVVAAALGRDEQQRPGGPVALEFPVRGALGSARRTAEVIGWTPTRPDDRGDIAVLRLDDGVPEGVRPLPLSPGPVPSGAEIKALGFPDDLSEQGIWAHGRLRDEQATGWLQVDAVSDARAISPGFSGTPVFGAEAGAVVGMVVAVVGDARHTTAFLHPVRTLLAEHPELQQAQASPYRGLAAFAERDAEYFRGRDQLIEDALGKAATHPLLVLIGPSGSGKSSLARAGLLPRLRAQGRTVVTARVLPDEPAAVLLSRILGELTGTPPDEPEPAAGRVAELLHDREGLVLLVDQFEEAGPDTARTITGYLHRLAEAAGTLADGSPRLLIVVTLRGGQLDTVATGETAVAMQAGLVLVAPMTAGQLRAAVTAPGAEFEPGLVERIVADAGTEPGTLPLLEFTLDRLWQRREHGLLTNAGYDELGGVEGAVARYADRTYERDPVRARRLLVLLAGPDDDGTFRRRPLRLADLPAGLRPTLDRLVAARLIVVGPGVAGEPVVELAHEALIRAWPRLGKWLAQDRAFLTWLTEIRRATRRWTETRREPDALLRGAALTTAARWADDRGIDLGADEAQFIRASLAQDHRRARRRRSVTAALVVLTMLAGAFALAAQQQTGVVRDQLRTAVSWQLADDAERFRRSDPATSLQLALAAWHTQQTPEAYGALFTQYATYEPVERLFTGLTATPGAPIESISTSRDGSVAVVVDQFGGGTVWRGLATGDPQRITFPLGSTYVGGSFQISPSGRYLGYANDLGGVYVRDITRPDLPPVDLAPSGPDRAHGHTVVKSLRFASDDSRLLVLRTNFGETSAELRMWDLRTRAPVPGLPPTAGELVPTAAFFGPGPGTVVLSTLSMVAAHDLTGRREPRIFRGGNTMVTVAAGGALVVSCRDEKVTVRDIGTGKVARTVALPSCAGFEMDAASEFGTVGKIEGDARGTNATLVVLDPRTGEVRQVATPPADFITGFVPIGRLAVYRGPAGGPGALIADGTQLYRLPLGPPVTLHRTVGFGLDLGGRTLVTPDGAHRVRFDTGSGRITVVQARTNEQLAATAAEPLPKDYSFHGIPYAITGDSRHLLTAHHGELVVYALPALTVEHRARLSVPPGLGALPITDNTVDDWAGSVVAVGAGEAIVLYAGVLTRWNVVTGTPIGEPVELREGEQQGARSRAAQLAFASGRRPGHLDQVAVVMPDSTVQLWSLDRRRAVATFQADPTKDSNSAFFSPDGSRLAVHQDSEVLAVWPVSDPRRTPWTIPIGVGVSPLGFTPGLDSHLVTVDSSGATELGIWEVRSAKRVATLTAPISSNVLLRRDELRVSSDGYARQLRLDPQLWYRRLCELAARPYTSGEIRLLRERKAPLSRPCP